MVTKAVVREVITETIDGEQYNYYRVSMPIFNDDDISESELSIANTCLPPHMYKTTYNVGDIVYVAVEDLDSSKPVILGMQQVSQEAGLFGSSQTESSVSIENADEISTTPQARVVLPHDILIRASADINAYKKEDFIDSTNQPYVNGEELSYVRGVNSPIQEQINSTNREISESFNTLLNVSVTTSNPAEVVVDAQKWFDSGVFPGVDVEYLFSYDKTIKAYRCGPYRTFSVNQLERVGIIFTRSSGFGEVRRFTVTAVSGPVRVSAGGTGATTAEQARQQLGLKQQILMSSDEWDNISANDLDVNTIYYIY